MRLDGNIGLRYVASDNVSVGSIGFPTQRAIGVDIPFTRIATDPTTGAVLIDPNTGQPLRNGRCDVQSIPPGAPPGTTSPPVSGVCTLGPAGYAALQTFASGVTTTDVARNNYHYFLPSLNLKFGLSRDMLLRFSASKVLARRPYWKPAAPAAR